MSLFTPPSHEQIALCAYFIYEHEGCLRGRELDHWLQAEAQLFAIAHQEAGRISDTALEDFDVAQLHAPAKPQTAATHTTP